jgi:LacI family transcriptional regulator
VKRQGQAPRLTINDIARLAKVSKKTVSRVINQSPLLTAKTRDKVLAVIREVGYQPDAMARGLAFRRSFLVGFIYDNPNAQYVIDLEQGILDLIREVGYELVVHPCKRSQENFLADVRAFIDRQKLVGVVLPPRLSEDESIIALLEQLDCPYVRIAGMMLDQPDRMVVSNDRLGGQQAGRHLAALGHRVIGHISGPDDFRSSIERGAGLAEGLAESGIALDPAYCLKGGYTYDSGIDCAKILLALQPRPTAIFAGNDEMAVGVYRAAHEAGLTLPDQLSVIGFDDSPIAAKVWPGLTSIRLPIRDMGRLAARKLLAQAQIGEEWNGQDVDLHPSLTERQSTARPT